MCYPSPKARAPDQLGRCPRRGLRAAGHHPVRDYRLSDLKPGDSGKDITELRRPSKHSATRTPTPRAPRPPHHLRSRALRNLGYDAPTTRDRRHRRRVCSHAAASRHRSSALSLDQTHSPKRPAPQRRRGEHHAGLCQQTWHRAGPPTRNSSHHRRRTALSEFVFVPSFRHPSRLTFRVGHITSSLLTIIRALSVTATLTATAERTQGGHDVHWLRNPEPERQRQNQPDRAYTSALRTPAHHPSGTLRETTTTAATDDHRRGLGATTALARPRRTRHIAAATTSARYWSSASPRSPQVPTANCHHLRQNGTETRVLITAGLEQRLRPVTPSPGRPSTSATRVVTDSEHRSEHPRRPIQKYSG